MRWYHGTISDPKWRVIAKRTGQTVSAVVSIWAALLENASESQDRGTLSGWDPEVIATALDLTPEVVVTVCNAMQQKVLNGDHLAAWSKRNPKREREDDSTERVQRFREKKKGVTPRNATKRPEQNREENTNTVDLKAGFEKLWGKYPAKDGRKEAEKHFSASVKTDSDLADCTKALANYLEHLRRETWKKPKNGSTWFNNWRDWIDPPETSKRGMPEKPVPVC